MNMENKKEDMMYFPSQQVIDRATVKEYDKMYQYSVENSEKFWEEQAGYLSWYKKWDKVLNKSNPPFYKWFEGAKTNIILNALDSMESGKGLIQISTTYLDDEFKVRFSDNGAGIPPDKVTKIFEPFFTTKDPGRGTGLGLSICHRIVKQHGGFIQVDSLTGTGTSFTISLPRNNR